MRTRNDRSISLCHFYLFHNLIYTNNKQKKRKNKTFHIVLGWLALIRYIFDIILSMIMGKTVIKVHNTGKREKKTSIFRSGFHHPLRPTHTYISNQANIYTLVSLYNSFSRLIGKSNTKKVNSHKRINLKMGITEKYGLCVVCVCVGRSVDDYIENEGEIKRFKMKR